MQNTAKGLCTQLIISPVDKVPPDGSLLRTQGAAEAMWVGRAGRGQQKGRCQLCRDFHILNVVVELVLSQNPSCYQNGRNRFKVPPADAPESTARALCDCSWGHSQRIEYSRIFNVF